ncbi:MAG: VOC family protein [Candidatus Hydrogenedentes bacterium]|nr:VOC family protein [Candidatus Hydrogenedentota bacterium]
MRVQAYMDFNGRCDEAIAFYEKTLGAKVVMLMRYKDSPDPNACAAGTGDKVMHSCIQIGETQLFASDGRNSGQTNFAGIMLSLGVTNDADAEKCFAALSEGGNVFMPMGPTFFASKFGMLTDKFGVHWMVINPLEQ